MKYFLKIYIIPIQMAREWFAATCNYKIITDNFPPSANKRGRLNGK
jgi:hypothetical protein